MLVYALSVGAYLAFVVYGYRAAGDRVLVIGWTFIAALAAALLVAWITVVNFVYLLLQIAMAVEGVGLGDACRAAARFIRAEFRELAGVFLVVVALVIAATLASALAWSGVGLIAFVPLVGLAVFPLQLAALLLRGLVFEYLGLTALGAYLTLYRGHLARRGEAEAMSPRATASSPLGNTPRDRLRQVSRGAARTMQESAIRKMGALGLRVPDLISFAPGFPAPEMFAWDEFRDVARSVLDGTDASVLQYGPRAATGRSSRRCRRFSPSAGFHATPERAW